MRGAKPTCMKDYMKPSLRNAPNYFILHVGTNDLNSDKTSKSIANTIIDLATSVKNEQYDVSLSNIILGMDNSKLNEKRCLVNSIFAEMCKEKTYLTDYSLKITSRHLKRSKLHLHKKGSTVLSNTV